MTHRPAQPARVRLLREIAGGPMSGTFVAERTRGEANDLVTVKVLRQRTRGDVDRLMKIRDASRELASLGHAHIVCVEDVAQVGDRMALVEPWVDGIDLADCMEAGSALGDALSPKARCELVLGVAEALDAALNEIPPGGKAPLGRVHRDIRPSNLMIGRDGSLNVMDFGTGFTTLAGRSARAGALQKGIIKYMSPARREGKRGGPPADVYSLGIVAVELFRRRALRRLRSQNPDHDRYLAEVVARMGDLGTGTATDDLALRNILLRMVAFDPEARPEAREVAIAFQGLAERARGISLARFAETHVASRVPDPRKDPDPALAGILVRILDTGATFDDVPVDDGEAVPDRLKLGADRAGLLWEETDEGWRETGVDTADEMAAIFDDEDTIAEDTPLPGAPRLEDAIPRQVPVIAMDEFDTESTTVPRGLPPDVDTFPTDTQRLPEPKRKRDRGGGSMRWLLVLAVLLVVVAVGAGLLAGALFALLR